MKERLFTVKNLDKKYKDIYKQTELFLRRDLISKEEQKTVLREFFELLIEAQQQNTPVQQLFPEGYEIFYQDLISGLATYTAPEKRKRILRIKIATISFIFLCVSIIAGLYLNSYGYIGFWTQGIGYIATDFNNYAYSAETMEQSISFEIDFSQFESYRDVVIYCNGDITIEIATIDKTDGLYRIFFRTHGVYSRNSATIVSWRKYAFNEQHIAEWTPTAKLFFNYDAINYECNLLGFTNMDRKDGEEFSYYIPSFVSDTNTISFNLSNLTYSHWKRKSEMVVRV